MKKYGISYRTAIYSTRSILATGQPENGRIFKKQLAIVANVTDSYSMLVTSALAEIAMEDNGTRRLCGQGDRRISLAACLCKL